MDVAYVKKGGHAWIEGRTNGAGPPVRVKGLSAGCDAPVAAVKSEDVSSTNVVVSESIV